jgi:transcriptional regulator with XRE-family HTH domain
VVSEGLVVDGQSSIGERIRQLRQERSPRMTQRELAERAGVSVDTVSKLEQGVKQTALIGTLHRIAQALDVDVSALLAKPARIDTEDGGTAGVLAIRRALTALYSDGEPVALGELRTSVAAAWAHYWTNRFNTLGALLPELIAQARAAGDGPEASAVRSDVYGVTASMLVSLGHVDLAYLAMERAITAAEGSGDELRRAAVSGWMSWLLLHQTGSYDQAQRLAVTEADRTEPRLGIAPPQAIAVWGGLLVSAAVAAARNDRPDEADDLLNLAEAAAVRVGAQGYEVSSHYERPFGVPLVLMQAVDIAVVTDRPGRALALAARMPPDADLPDAAKARHLADIAFAQTATGRDTKAVDTLLRIERQAPSWMRYQSYPRTIIRELLERERRARTPRLRGLAVRMGIEAAA